MTTKSVPSTLLGLFEHIPSQKTAIISPEANLHISYGSLLQQVIAVAEQLAAAGITRGDRVGCTGALSAARRMYVLVANSEAGG